MLIEAIEFRSQQLHIHRNDEFDQLIIFSFLLFFYFSVDNKSKRQRRTGMRQDFTAFVQTDETNFVGLTPQLALATFQYMATCKWVWLSTRVLAVAMPTLSIKSYCSEGSDWSISVILFIPFKVF